MRSSLLSDCFYFILFSLVFFLFPYTGQLLVHFVPCYNPVVKVVIIIIIIIKRRD